jgi:hypothetical protein
MPIPRQRLSEGAFADRRIRCDANDVDLPTPNKLAPIRKNLYFGPGKNCG